MQKSKGHRGGYNGTITVLHVGDFVKKGEVVLTAQDGIVQIEAHPSTLLAAAAPGSSLYHPYILQAGERGHLRTGPFLCRAA